MLQVHGTSCVSRLTPEDFTTRVSKSSKTPTSERRAVRQDGTRQGQTGDAEATGSFVEAISDDRSEAEASGAIVTATVLVCLSPSP